MSFGQLSLGFSITGKVKSSFGKMTKAIKKDLRRINKEFGLLQSTRLDGRSMTQVSRGARGVGTALGGVNTRLGQVRTNSRQTFGALGNQTSRGANGVQRLGREVRNAGQSLTSTARRSRELNRELARLRALSRIEVRMGNARQQFADLRGQALGVVATGYSLGRMYSSAANVLKAQGDIATLGITEKGIQAITTAGQEMSLQFGQISAPQFIKASYDIKSGIASLTEDGVKDFTRMAGVTAVATKSSVEEMTKLYALGYGIFRKDFGSDVDFGQQFSGAIASSVQAFKTDGSDLSQGLANIGSDAKAMGVSLAEELAIIGIAKEGLNSASEAGTKYRAFLGGAGKAQKKLGLTFTDSAGRMLPMVDILNTIKNKYGEIDVASKMELDKAFGSSEATGLIVSLINKTDKLSAAQRDLNKSMQGGLSKAEEMAAAADRGQGFEKLGNSFAYIGYTLGKVLAPAVEVMASGVGYLAKGIAWLDNSFPVLIPSIVGTASALGALFIVTRLVKLGTIGLQMANLALSRASLQSTASTTAASGANASAGIVARVSAAGHYVLRGALAAVRFVVGGLASAFSLTTMRTVAHGVASKTAAVGHYVLSGALGAVRFVTTGLAGLFSLAAIRTTAYSVASKAAAAGQWVLNAAMTANPIGLLIAGVAALAAGAVWLYKNFEPFTNLVNMIWSQFEGLFSYISESWSVIGDLFSEVTGFLGFGDDDDDKKQKAKPVPKLATATSSRLATLPASQSRLASPNNLAPSTLESPVKGAYNTTDTPDALKDYLSKPYPAAPTPTQVTQNMTVQVTVNKPASNLDIEKAIASAMRKHARGRGTSLADETF